MHELGSKDVTLMGNFYYFGKSRCYQARLSKVGQGLQVELHVDSAVAGEVCSYRLDGISVSDVLGSLPSRFVFANGDAFESHNWVDFDNILEAQKSSFSRVIHQLEKNTKVALLAIFMLPLLVYGTLFWMMPIAATHLAATVPPALVQ